MFLSSQTVTHDQDTNCSPPFSRKTIRNFLLGLRKNLCTSAIIIVQVAQDRKGDDLATFMIWWY
jgi:hypothetical protein